MTSDKIGRNREQKPIVFHTNKNRNCNTYYNNSYNKNKKII